MSAKTMNELIAKRANLTNLIREMVGNGITNENQHNYDKAIADFTAMTKQIDDLKMIEGIDNSFTDIIKNVNPKEGFMNFMRFGDTANVEKIVNAVGVGTSSAGYLVPEELHNAIVRIMYETGAMMDLSDVITTKTLLDIPIDGTAPTAYWVEEAGTYSDSSPTVGRIQLGANKVGAMVKVSEELLADSAFNVEAYLNQLAGTALGRAIENECINGTVSGRPTGILGTATRGLTSSVTNSFGADDLIGLFTSVKTPYRNQGSWLIGSDSLGTIMKLKDGASQYVFQPSYTAGQSDLLFGKALKTSEYMPALTTTAKGILFGDFSNYKIGLRGGMGVQRLNELYAGNGQVGFRYFTRVDGKLALAESVKYLACL